MARKHLMALASNPASGLPPATLFLMGQLAEYHARLMRQARGTLAKYWRKVRGRRWKTLRAKLASLSENRPVGSHATGAAPDVAALLPGTDSAAAAAARPL